MYQRPVLVFGAGGHARCVLDAIEAAGGAVEAVVGRSPADGETFYDLPVWGEDEVLAGKGPAVGFVAVGANAARQAVVERIRERRPDFVFPTVVHPKAVISRTATVGEGCVLLAGAVLNPKAVLGAHCSLYSNAVVEHDCMLGDYVTLAPAAALGGAVRLGARVFIGLGAVVSHGVAVGADTVVGAGAAVLKDQPENSVVVGAPGRKVSSRAKDDPYL